jgi:hypothetical protein
VSSLSPLPTKARHPALLVSLALLVVAGAVLAGRFLDVRAQAAAVPFTPNDGGRGARAAGWTQLQWNFVGPYGVDAPHAWGNLIAAGASGGAGVTVAVLDTGVAYSDGRTRSRPETLRRRLRLRRQRQ